MYRGTVGVCTGLCGAAGGSVVPSVLPEYVEPSVVPKCEVPSVVSNMVAECKVFMWMGSSEMVTV